MALTSIAWRVETEREYELYLSGRSGLRFVYFRLFPIGYACHGAEFVRHLHAQIISRCSGVLRWASSRHRLLFAVAGGR